ncbi:IclR family transcriptional regulator [Actinospongicola halichondriae]|uniref:IclR family transcriptional regulator n=1 Tax=Actinospongicola halichondriae TaxID=3236844 RepID=UPI003D38F94F
MDTVSGIGVLDKAVRILDVVAAGPVRPSELPARTGISRATAHRLAVGLEVHGLLRRNADGAFVAGLALIGLGRAASDSFPLTVAAAPALEALRDRTGESSQLYVAEGDERLCVAAVDSAHELRTIVGVGARLPLEVGSAGRVLSGEVGRDGWVASVAERASGVASVSAPVRRDGAVIAAVSVSGPIERVTRRPGSAFGGDVTAAAREIEAALRSD